MGPSVEAHRYFVNKMMLNVGYAGVIRSLRYTFADRVACMGGGEQRNGLH
jgi:hypothetical protein